MTESVDGGEVVTVENLQERRNLYCNLTFHLHKMLGKSKKNIKHILPNGGFNGDLRWSKAKNRLKPIQVTAFSF